MKLFENLPSTNTPINAENLNGMQQDIGVVVSEAEPTNENRLRVWIQKGKNLMNLTHLESSNQAGITAIKNKNGSITFNGTTEEWGYTIHLLQKPIEITSDCIGSGTGTLSGAVLNVAYSRNGEIKYSPLEATIFNKGDIVENIYVQQLSGNVAISGTIYPQIEPGTVITNYEPYIEQVMYVKNNNGAYEKFASKPPIKVVRVNYNNSLTLESGASTEVHIDIPNIDGYELLCCVGGSGVGATGLLINSSLGPDINKWVVNTKNYTVTYADIEFVLLYSRI